MPTPAPLTKYNEIAEKMTLMLRHNFRFQSRDSLEWRMLVRDCNALRDASPPHGWLMLGLANAIVGDVDATDKSMSNALQLGLNPEEKLNAIMGRIALGQFSKAQALLRDIGSPRQGLFTRLLPIGLVIGNYQFLKDKFPEAELMGLDVASLPQYRGVLDLAKLCSDAGLNDDDVAAQLDAVGVVLRRHRLIPNIKVTSQKEGYDDEARGAAIAFGVDVSPTEAFQLNVELAQEEEELKIKKHWVIDALFITLNKDAVHDF